MILRTSITACCLVVGLAAPAQAQDVDDCTSALVASVAGSLLGADDPYPIVEVHPSGTVEVHTQNVVPSVEYTAGRLVAYPGELGGYVIVWVQCVD